jgi:hypothetical protein
MIANVTTSSIGSARAASTSDWPVVCRRRRTNDEREMNTGKYLKIRRLTVQDDCHRCGRRVEAMD